MFVIISITVLVAIVVYRFLAQLFLPLRGIPEPKGWPLLGHLPLFMLEKDHLKLFAKWCDQFKAEGLFKVDSITGKLMYCYNKNLSRNYCVLYLNKLIFLTKLDD